MRPSAKVRAARSLGCALLMAACGGGEGAATGPDAGLGRPANPTCAAPVVAVRQGTVGLPARLSESGCFDPADPRRPLPALIPYDVNAPLWSDGAAKDRWLALPDGAHIRVNADGDFELPAGTVLIKRFRFGERLVETRFLVRHPDGGWSGYTYEWDDAGRDAVLLPEGGRRKQVGAVEWSFPTRSECGKCHTAAAGHALGLELRQLDREGQLAALERRGLFEAPSPGRPAALVDPADESAPLEARARAYLHANCANCHRPEVDNAGAIDLRITTSLAATMACDAEPTKGSLGYGPEMRVIAPGRPDLSMLIVRMQIQDSGRMPPIGSSVVDQRALALLSTWVTSLSSCR